MLAGATVGAGVPDVQAVYLLPMAGGLDQYLANRLTSAGVFRVVTDPKMADAIFTDQLGAGFEQKLTDLYTPPPEDDDKDSRRAPHASAFGHGKGTVFLVDLKSHAVIWSLYEKPGRATPDVLNRTASHIVQQIKKQQKTK
jgi:hypothetical protein